MPICDCTECHRSGQPPTISERSIRRHREKNGRIPHGRVDVPVSRSRSPSPERAARARSRSRSPDAPGEFILPESDGDGAESDGSQSAAGDEEQKAQGGRPRLDCKHLLTTPIVGRQDGLAPIHISELLISLQANHNLPNRALIDINHIIAALTDGYDLSYDQLMRCVDRVNGVKIRRFSRCSHDCPVWP